MTVNDAYDHDEEHDGFNEVLEGHEEPHGQQVHEDDDLIYFHLHIDKGDEDHESDGINLFLDVEPNDDGIFMTSDKDISCEEGMV